jgi:hypothetical protein
VRVVLRVAARTVLTYTQSLLQGVDMPRFTKESDGRTITVETSVPREAAQLRAEGFTEQKARTAAVRESDAVNSTSAAKSPEADAAKADAPTPTK